MWHSKEYKRGEEWRWWQRLAPHAQRWSGLERSRKHAEAHYPWWQRLAHVFIPHARNGYKPHAVRRHALAAYSLILVGAKVALSLGLFLTFPTPAYFSSLTAQRIITLTNEARAHIGIAPMQGNDVLQQSAAFKAEEMARQGYFAHTNPQGESPWEWFKRAGYVYTYAGENLAMDFNNAEEVVEAWMESPKHRENILNPKYRDIGIAVTTGAVDGRTVTLVVQHFGASFAPATSSSFAARGAVYGAVTGTPQVAAAAVESTIAAGRTWWDTALQVFPWVVGIFVLWLVLQLFLTIFVHVHIQHYGAVYATVLVIGLALGILSLNVHFLETLGNAPIVF
ncbi:hypothetical protein A3J36_01480 [Candidatus Uhrbacteria bacterium RIFCSPLOWO2_02_FULL_54_37]|uniref:SCP domain-containing protein n=1 Tax=Candidatus Uhrbacteria bacterium RIFCSPLOWO2_02_FULL_54_37 TaxID=1802412 RepID=A0A1F7VI36_9BACT|nr:MAG: hypothetical protein A3J36_01480 [Candidatus Uhrbacteria bacterium RIFCSPLOWO2_02_FULL_54_37]